MSKEDLFEFFRAQIAAFIGTAIDYTLFIILKEFVGIWYIYANIIGAIIGAISNFLLGRYWAFNVQSEVASKQAGKYFLVALGSLLLNTSGIFMLTEWVQLDPILSKVIIGLLVAICFNFVLQKNFVFKKGTETRNNE